MTKRIIAIAVIYIFSTIAWAILGATVFIRTNASNSTLRNSVASLWGAPQEQTPTDAWYSTYTVRFAGAYDFRDDSDQPRRVVFSLNFPTAQAIYDDVTFSVNGAPLATSNAKTQAYAPYTIPPHQTATFQVGYRSQGLEKWTYNFGDQVNQVKDFELRLTTDFSGFDFPDNSLSPTDEHRDGSGWTLVWNYKNLISGYKIGLAMPEKLQPGPLTGRISFFAPVSLLFFFFILFVLTTVRQIDLHPMNYFFLACAFFSFHLLMAYLVDHLSVNAAFLIC